jgi:hypothetical protein
VLSVETIARIRFEHDYNGKGIKRIARDTAALERHRGRLQA